MQYIYSRSVIVLGLAISSIASAEELPSVTPYRPTVSNPAALSQPGWLEVEVGFNSSKATDDSSRGSLPYLMKFAFSDKLGVMLGGDAYVEQTDINGTRLGGEGDTLVLVKQKWPISAAGNTALGAEYGFKSPTAKKGLGTGKADYLVNGIFSTELSDNTIDLNVNLTELGEAQAGESRQQWGWAASWARALNEKWGIAAEVSETQRQGVATSTQFLAAFNYNMSRRVVWDAGMSAGLTPAAPKWSVFAGVSILAGRLW